MEQATISLKKISGIEVIFVLAVEYPSADHIVETAKEILKLKEKHNCMLTLFDARNSKSTPATFESFLMGKKLLALNGIKEIRTAIVSSEAIKPGVRFFSTFARNRGYMFKVFSDMQSAEEWLIS